jgi:hypothetical protein
MNSMIIDVVLFYFILNYNNCVEVLTNNCHKRWRMDKLRNLFLEFEVPFIFHVMLFFEN